MATSRFNPRDSNIQEEKEQKKRLTRMYLQNRFAKKREGVPDCFFAAREGEERLFSDHRWRGKNESLEIPPEKKKKAGVSSLKSQASRKREGSLRHSRKREKTEEMLYSNPHPRRDSVAAHFLEQGLKKGGKEKGALQGGPGNLRTSIGTRRKEKWDPGYLFKREGGKKASLRGFRDREGKEEGPGNC